MIVLFENFGVKKENKLTRIVIFQYKEEFSVTKSRILLSIFNI